MEDVEENEKFGRRHMTYEDCADVAKWRNSVKNYYIYREDLTLEQEQRYFRDKVQTCDVTMLIICIKGEPDRGVGCVVIEKPDYTTGTAEYGLFIGDDSCRGLGLGRWAIRAMQDYARDVMGLVKITCRIFTDNYASWKSNEHAGFVRTDRILDVTCSDGEHKQMYWYEAEL
jgi:RimJ/RimL family protein N-acetyltransferase